MIVRIWEGKTKTKHAEVYENLITKRDIPNYKKSNGFIKLIFLKRSNNTHTYFKLLTFWENVEKIKEFTGPNFEIAVAYQNDQQYLIDFPGTIEHFEVFAEM